MSENDKEKDNMNDIQKLLEEQRKQSDIHKLSEARINRIIANKEKAKDPEWREAVKEGIKRRPPPTDEWKEANKRAAKKKSESAEWQEAHKNNMQKLAKTPEWQEAIKKRNESTQWRKAQKEGMEKLAKTPEWRESVKRRNLEQSQTPEWKESVKKGRQKSRLKEENYNTCIHCNTKVYITYYKNFHGDYCKQNPNRIIRPKKHPKYECVHCGMLAPIKAYNRLHGDNCKKLKKSKK